MRICRLLLLATLVPAIAFAQDAAPRDFDFARDILPILSDNCFFCHGPDAQERQADLRLDVQGEAHASAITPGEPAESELIARITAEDEDVLMPPPESGKSLSPQQIDLLRTWIASGGEYEKHWSLRTIQKPTVAARPQHPIDFFINQQSTAAGVEPTQRAPLRTLVRRATLDLTGLPPTIEEVNAFLLASKDNPKQAWSDLLDRLLSSPAYGERMAWDWLDAARYADSNGYQGDNDRTMWPWRDWVVDAFNQNKPWNEFTREQIAGDLIPDATDEQILATGFLRNHMINGEGGRIAEENRVEYVFDMTETVGTIWLGLTFQCCRCHDHKFDDLSQRDYFTMSAFFNQTPVDGGGGNGQTPPVLAYANEAEKKQLAELGSLHAAVASAVARFEKALQASGTLPVVKEGSKLPEDVAKALRKPAKERNGKELSTLRDHFKSQEAPPKQNGEAEKQDGPLQVTASEVRSAQRDLYAQLCNEAAEAFNRLDQLKRRLPKVMVMKDRDKPRTTYILDRGLYNKHGEEVSSATPSSMKPLPPKVAANRLALADWILDSDNPLTARVTVNRFWQLLFGRGLVKTTEDFGVQGEYPSHPELLDWLAADFVESDWDVKRLIKTVMSSEAYQRDSSADPKSYTADPTNRLFARGARHRLPSWMIRDQALAVSGLINRRHGGPSVNTYQPPGVWKETTFGKKTHNPAKGEDLYRRSLYVFWRRIIGPTIFFDSGKRQVCEVKHDRTNTPLHSLTTMNATTYVESARALAERVMTSMDSPKERLQLACRLVLAREADDSEQAIWLNSLAKAKAHFVATPDAASQLLSVGNSKRNEDLDAIEHAAYATVCLNLLNLDETVTKE